MAENAPSHHVLVAFDFSETAKLALDEGLRMASEVPGATLHVVHVASGYGPMLQLDLGYDVRTVGATEAEEVLAKHVKELLAERDAKVAHAMTHLRVGAAADEIVATAAKLDADVIVVGTHGRTGVKRLLLGSVAEAVVRNAGCPVLVVRPKDYPAPEPHA